MKINGINSNIINFRADSAKNDKKNSGFLSKFETGIRNSADMNDTLKVPRTIFKGYLAFMVSTTMVTLASFINPKHNKIKNCTNIAASLLALYGTYSFVRPYVIKGSTEKTT